MQASDFERRTIKKITWKLIPFLCVCYMAAFIDRVNVGFAKEQMVGDLGFSSAVYGLGAGIFFIGYFLFEVPSNLVLERVGARLWIARIMIVWGLISACMMFVHDATTFYVLRFLLGAAEAGFFPGIILYQTYWFPRAYRSRTIALFMTAAVMSNIVGSPLSGLLLELDGAFGIRGWKWLFMVEGLPSIILGAVVFAILPNGPRQAKWLGTEEREWLEARLAGERGDASTDHKVNLKDAFTDYRVLLLCLVYFTHVIAGYGLDFFMPTLLKQAVPSASSAFIGLLNAIPPLFAVIGMIAIGRSSDRSNERKWHFAACLWWAAAGLLLASLPVSPAVALVALSLAVSGRWSGVAPFWGLSTAFLSGRAAAGAIALVNSVGNLGGFVGPYLMGWFKDHTGAYTVGLRVLASVAFCGGLLALTIRIRKASATNPLEATAEARPQLETP